MMMANSHRQRIGCVGRTDRLSQTKERLDHLLDLGFTRSAISRDRAFNLQRRILRNGDPTECGCQHCNPSRLAQLKRALYVFCEDKAFDGCPLRLITTDQLGQAAEDLLQAERKGVAGCGDDAAVLDGSQDTISASHHPVAGSADSRINS